MVELGGEGMAAEQRMQQVEIGLVDADEANIRSELGAIDELAASLKEHGFIQPLVGFLRDGRVKLIAGHRRLAAAKLLGLERVPVLIREVDVGKAKQLQMTENVQREDMPALDVADALYALVNSGIEIEEVAATLGKSSNWVRRHLRLKKTPPIVEDAIRRYRLKFTQAEQVTRIVLKESVTAALEAAKAMASGKTSRRKVEAASAKSDGREDHKQVFTTEGHHFKGLLKIDSRLPVDSVRAKQLSELMNAVNRIMAWG